MLLIVFVRYRVGVWRLGCNPPFGRKTAWSLGELLRENRVRRTLWVAARCDARFAGRRSEREPRRDRKTYVSRARSSPRRVCEGDAHRRGRARGVAAPGRAVHPMRPAANYSRRLNPGTPGPITRAMQRGSSRLGRAPAGWPGCPTMATRARVPDLERQGQHRWRPWRRTRRAPRTPMVRWLESGVIPMLIDCSRASAEETPARTRGPRALGAAGCLASRPRGL